MALVTICGKEKKENLSTHQDLLIKTRHSRSTFLEDMPSSFLESNWKEI